MGSKPIARRREAERSVLQEAKHAVFEDYRIDVLCEAGYQFVDEEHGERDAAQAGVVVCETGEGACHCLHFVDEEGEEE